MQKCVRTVLQLPYLLQVKILPLLRQIKQEKNKIVSITNNRQSTIAKISDINIPYYVNEEYYESANITTQFPVLFLLEWMAKEVTAFRKLDFKTGMLFFHCAYNFGNKPCTCCRVSTYMNFTNLQILFRCD